LNYLDLFPLFSFLALKGKCRYCGEKISPRYPIFEALTGVLYVLCFLQYGISLYTLIGFVLMSVLVCVAMIDYDTKIVYDRWHLILLFIAIASFLVNRQISFPDRMIGALLIGFISFLLAYFTKGVGYGDVKLMTVMGLILGWKLNLFAFFGGYVLATIFLIIPMLQKKIKPGTEIPMVPYFAIMSAVAFLYGDSLIGWYINTFVNRG
jgi:leader peptidase (prepilin peptidase)/N-methyltransferase